jgi:hypothetical protein
MNVKPVGLVIFLKTKSPAGRDTAGKMRMLSVVRRRVIAAYSLKKNGIAESYH